MRQLILPNIEIQEAIICLGLPASGKTIYWKNYYPHYTILDPYNELKEMSIYNISKLSYNYYKKILERRSKDINSSINKKINKALDDKKGIFFANSEYLDTTKRKRLIRYLFNHGFKVTVIWLDVDPITCLERNRKKSDLRKRVPEKEIVKYCKDYVFIKYGNKLIKESREIGYKFIITI